MSSEKTESLLERAVEWAKKFEDCKRRNHPYDQNIVVPYHPGSDVLMGCSNCGFLYERSPTRKEKESYQSLFKLRVTI